MRVDDPSFVDFKMPTKKQMKPFRFKPATLMNEFAKCLAWHEKNRKKKKGR